MTCVQKIKRSVTLFAQFITTFFRLREFFEFCKIRFSEQTTFTQKTKRSKIFAQKELAPFFTGRPSEDGVVFRGIQSLF